MRFSLHSQNTKNLNSMLNLKIIYATVQGIELFTQIEFVASGAP